MILHVRILGAAAGGGLPQWNCGCQNCQLARSGVIPPQTQSSIAVSVDGRSWAVLNASPDIRQQLNDAPSLHPTGLREVPLHSVLVTNGDIDHIAGLLVLREQQAFKLFATGEIHSHLSASRMFNALAEDKVSREAVTLGNPFALLPGLEAELFAVPGKVPLYDESGDVATDLEGEQTVGVRLSSGKGQLFYIPGCARVTPALAERLHGADVLLFDGTLWRDDEMIAAGLSAKTGRRMGHISISGEDGSIAALAGLGIRRKVFIHINNTNPVLRPDSDERSEAEAAGWEIGHDGMEMKL